MKWPWTKPAAREDPDPLPGEKWIYWPANERKGDPFSPPAGRPVTVLDVKAGWVRYDLSDSRRPIKMFKWLYARLEEL